MSRDNWDDLRYVLAVADTGSVSGAARRLGVNHATVLRRIAAFEEEAQAELFLKTARGYSVPPDRARVVAAAREVEAAVQVVMRLLAGLRAPLAGTVRVTTTDALAALVLPGVVCRIRSSAPDLQIEILSSNHHVDMGRIQADIAVRPAMQLPEDLVGIHACSLPFAAFARRDTKPSVWLGLTGALERSIAAKWIASEIPSDRIAASADSFLVLAAMASRGDGIALLPHFVGAAYPELEVLPGLAPPLPVPIWVASHSDLAHVPRIARLRTLLAAELADTTAWGTGDGPT